MLDLLDSILGFSTILLGVSLLVTVVVQGLAGLFNLRGAALVEGLVELFVQAKFDVARARALASKILTHPLISDSMVVRFRVLSHWLHASAIRKDELLRVLAQADDFGLGLANRAEKEKLERAAGIVSVWFDGQMDRVSQAFAHRARIITIMISFLTAFLLHMDSVYLLGRVLSEPETRAKLVASADGLRERAERLHVSESSTGEGNALEVKAAVSEMKGIQKDLADSGIELLPRFAERADPEHGVHAAWDYLPSANDTAWRHLLGILASGALLSLGAPFWFNLLKSLANLRSVLAAKTEQERKQQTEEAS